MDATGPQRWDNERGDPAARRRAGILAQRERKQSRDSVLVGGASIDYDKLYDYYINALHDLLHNDKHNGPHHHHGPNGAILIHNDDCRPDDDILVTTDFHTVIDYCRDDYGSTVIDEHDIYGPHNHDTTRVAEDGDAVDACAHCGYRPIDTRLCDDCWHKAQTGS